MNVLEGTAWTFGNDVNTDLIVPGRYLLGDLAEVTAHVLDGARPGFSQEIALGDIVVAGSNFGGGSSRELAAVAMKEAGVAAVVATSFARIYFRNAINVGLPVVECPDAPSIAEGERIRIDLSRGAITRIEAGIDLRFTPYEGDILAILEAGGLYGFLEQRRDLFAANAQKPAAWSRVE